MAKKTGKRKKAPRTTMMQRIRSNFLTGLVIVAPIVLTGYLIWTVVTFIDAKVVPLVPAAYNPSTYLGTYVPGFGVVIFLVFTAIFGALTKGIFGRQLLRMWENLVGRTPVVRSIYSGLKQVVETVISQNNATFQKACLIEYPRRGIWVIGFITTDATGEVQEKTSDDMTAIFVPTTPNPTSGVFVYVPKPDVIILDMTIEDAAKLVISAGLVVPPTRAEIAARRKPAPKGK